MTTATERNYLAEISLPHTTKGHFLAACFLLPGNARICGAYDQGGNLLESYRRGQTLGQLCLELQQESPSDIHTALIKHPWEASHPVTGLTFLNALEVFLVLDISTFVGE